MMNMKPVARNGGPFMDPVKKQVLSNPVYTSVEEAITRLGSDKPIYCLYPDALRDNARDFLEGFPGTTLYAVKCNPDRDVLRLLHSYGVTGFEVASKTEIDLVLETLGGVRLYFMHPVKSREAIRHAYSLGVRDFAFDCQAELDKILSETQDADDLNLYLRLAVDNADAAHDLSFKFGAMPEEAIGLLQKARPLANRLGICFHVGSQCMAPSAYRKALTRVKKVVQKAAVDIEIIDVGGGFPAPYPGFRTPQLPRFFDMIEGALSDLGLADLEIMCEPGRALVAEAGSVLARVELRKSNLLYLNDGTYGALFDAGTLSWRYPARLVSSRKGRRRALQKFSLFGPTCDSLDAMPGPFLLPDDVQEGDWIEIQNLGGYGITMRTDFNGFKSNVFAIIEAKDGWPEFALSPVAE